MRYNTDQLGIEKKIGNADSKIRDTGGIVKKQILRQKLLKKNTYYFWFSY